MKELLSGLIGLFTGIIDKVVADKDQAAKEQATQQRKTRDMAMRKVRSELGNEVYYKIDHRLQNALIDAELKREDQQRQSFRDPPKPNETFRKH